MRQSTRLIVNTGATFGRMFITFGLGLVATRLLLQALGKIDFGLLMVLGAAGGMLKLFTDALTNSVQRHMAYEVGRGDERELGEVFNTALVMYLACGVLLYGIGQVLAPWVLGVLTIPPDRSDAAWWVFQTTLLSILVAVVGTPYRGVLAAHQELVVTSVAEVATGVLRLTAILAVLWLPGDPLVMFVMLQLLAGALVQAGMSLWCVVYFRVSRPRPSRFRWRQLKQIVGYASWTLLGGMATRLRMQGGVILLNLFFGPVVNAAYAIATQVAGYAGNFAYALHRVVNPAIISLEAKGARMHMQNLTVVTGKYITIFLSMLFVPVWLEAEAVLALWLGDYPPETVLLIRLVLIWAVGDGLTAGYNSALAAQGDIGWFTRWMVSLSALALAAAALTFYFTGAGPWALPAATIGMTAAVGFVRVRLIGRRVGLPASSWAQQVLVPVVLVIGAGLLVSLGCRWLLPEGLWRTLAVFAAFESVALPATWFIALRQWERRQFVRIGRTAWNRLTGGRVALST